MPPMPSMAQAKVILLAYVFFISKSMSTFMLVFSPLSAVFCSYSAFPWAAMHQCQSWPKSRSFSPILHFVFLLPQGCNATNAKYGSSQSDPAGPVLVLLQNCINLYCHVVFSFAFGCLLLFLFARGCSISNANYGPSRVPFSPLLLFFFFLRPSHCQCQPRPKLRSFQPCFALLLQPQGFRPQTPTMP